jgi:hypothetical protein
VSGLRTDGLGDNYTLVAAALALGGQIIFPPGDIRIVPPAGNGYVLTLLSASRVSSIGGKQGTRLIFEGTTVSGGTMVLLGIQGNVVCDGICVVNRLVTGSAAATPVIGIEFLGSGSNLWNGYLDGGTITTWGVSGITQANPAVVTTTNTHNITGPLTITAASKATNCQVTATAHGVLQAGGTFVISGVVGMVELNGLTVTINSIVDANTLTLSVNSTAFSTYTSGGTMKQYCVMASVGGMTQINGMQLVNAVTSNTITLAVDSSAFTTYTSGGTIDFGKRDRTCLGISMNASLVYDDIESDHFNVTGCSFGIFQSNSNTYRKTNFRVQTCKYYGNFFEDVSPNCPNAKNGDFTVTNCDVYNGQTHRMWNEYPNQGHLCISAASVKRLKAYGNRLKVRDTAGRFCKALHFEEWCEDFIINGNTAIVDGQTGTAAYGFYFLDANVSGTRRAPTGQCANNIAIRWGGYAATWARSGTTCTITSVAHPYNTGDEISITVTSDATAVPLTSTVAYFGVYTCTKLTDDTFTITVPNAGGASGTCTVGKAGGQGFTHNESATGPKGVQCTSNAAQGRFTWGFNWPNMMESTTESTTFNCLMDNLSQGCVGGYRIVQGGMSIRRNVSVDCDTHVLLVSGIMNGHFFKGSAATAYITITLPGQIIDPEFEVKGTDLASGVNTIVLANYTANCALAGRANMFALAPFSVSPSQPGPSTVQRSQVYSGTGTTCTPNATDAVTVTSGALLTDIALSTTGPQLRCTVTTSAISVKVITSVKIQGAILFK